MTNALAVAAVAAGLALPIGTYRATITAGDLTRGHAGVNPAGYAGTWSLQIGPGRHWSLRSTGPTGHLYRAPPRGGTYTRNGGTVVFTDAYSGGSVTARWSGGSGTLRFVVQRTTRPELRVLFGAHPWRKTG